MKIAAENPAAATRILRAIGAKIDLLADYPRFGPRRRDIRPRTRLLVEKPYLILYEMPPDTDDARSTKLRSSESSMDDGDLESLF